MVKLTKLIDRLIGGPIKYGNQDDAQGGQVSLWNLKITVKMIQTDAFEHYKRYYFRV